MEDISRGSRYESRKEDGSIQLTSEDARLRDSAEAREMALVLVMPAIAWGLKTQSRLECYAVWHIAGSIGGVRAKATVRG